MSRALRVLHVIPSVSPQRGGPSAALEAMVRGLARAGVTVEVATTDDDGPLRSNVPLGRPVDRAGAAYHFFRRQTRFYTISWPLQRWLTRNIRNFDVVHVHALFSFASVLACRSARRTGVPYIVRPLGVLAPYGLQQRAWLKRVSLHFVERPLLAGAAAIHCTSAAEEEEVRALGPHWRTIVQPLGVDTDYYQPLTGRALTAPYLLFLSRIHPKKGLELLLDALAGVAGQRLLIAGNGEPGYVTSLQERARSLGIADRVVWAGQLTGEEKLKALQAAALFVLPSYAENFGIAVAEALACGVPAIVSDRVALARQIREHRAGRVVPCDSAALADALRALMEDDHERVRLGTAARALALKELSSRSMTEGLMALYQSVRK